MGVSPLRNGKPRGFTIVELMFTVFIAAILLAIAVPGFQAISQRSRQANVVADLSTMIARARSEAVTRAAPVTICTSVDEATCNAGASDWEAGWIMFVDGTNRDVVANPLVAGVAANQIVDGADVLLQVGQAVNQGTVRVFGFGNAPSAITFGTDGLLAQQGSIRYCDERGFPSLRMLIVNLAGQVRMAVDTDADGEMEDETGVGVNSCI